MWPSTFSRMLATVSWDRRWVWRYGSMEIWDMEVWRYGSIGGGGVWRYGGRKVSKVWGMEVWRYGGMEDRMRL